MTSLDGHPLVVGVVPGHPEFLTPTAVSLSRAPGPVPSLSRALGPVPLCFAAAALLSRHRHRPVRVVPLSVVDRVVPAPWA